MGNFSNYWDLHTLFTKLKNKLKSISDKIDDSVSLKTATGNPITLTDAANANAEELSMTIEPIQSGSGDPSPTNVRPISGISTASVQTTDGTDTNTATITLGQTVYGGSVNFKTGEVTVTHGIVTFNGSETWVSSNGSDNACMRVECQMPSETKANVDNNTLTGYVSNMFVEKTPNETYTGGASNIGFSISKYTVSGFCMASICQTGQKNMVVADWKTYLASNPLQVCYELATPITFTLTPAELELLKGNNTITANGAEISIEYYPDNAIGTLAGRVDDKADITYVDNIKNVKVTDTFSASPTKQGAYIVVYGSTVDITSFVPNSDWQCWVFPVVPGDSFVITVAGSYAPRAYCFIDENGNVLSRAAASEHLTQTLITAEKKGFCIIQNYVVSVPNPSIVGTLTVPNSAYAKIGYLSAQIDKAGTAEATKLKSALPSAVGWYRFARYIRSTNHAGVEGAGGQTVNFQISRVYRNTPNESYSISFASARSKYIFRVINAAVNEQLVTKVRYVTDSNTDTVGYLEFYYASNSANDINIVLDRTIDFDLVDITQNTGSPIVLSEFDLTGARNSASGTVLTDKSLATKYLHYISIQRYNNDAATIDVTIPIINNTAATMTKTEILAYLDEYDQHIKPIHGMYHNIYQGNFVLPEPIVDFIYAYYEGSEDKRLIFYRFENDDITVTPTNSYLRIEDRFVVQIVQNA